MTADQLKTARALAADLRAQADDYAGILPDGVRNRHLDALAEMGELIAALVGEATHD